MNKIELEDIAVIFATEFVKMTSSRKRYNQRLSNLDFLKMNFSRRKKLCSKVIDRIMEDSRKST